MNAPVLNATVPESGIVKDASGNILLKYYSHQQLIRWFVQEGLGDMEDFQKRGFKIEPMSPYGREARNERAAEGVKRFGTVENILDMEYRGYRIKQEKDPGDPNLQVAMVYNPQGQSVDYAASIAEAKKLIDDKVKG